MNKDKKNGLGNDPKNTDKNGRNELGKYTTGNDGKPKGATNKNTRYLKEFITGFLNDKSNEIPILWKKLDDKDKLSLFTHLCRLVLPKDKIEMDFIEKPIFMAIDLDVEVEEKNERIKQP
jgi:hypothetical protein